MKEQWYFEDSKWNASDFTYTFDTGSKIEFFSTDNGDKLRGARRDRLFLNECNNITAEAFEQLEVRTKEFVYLDWNPSSEFWFYSDVKDRGDCDFIILTYKDNEALDPEIVKAIEARRDKKNWWTVYWEWQLWEIEWRIYTGWNIIDEIPHEARLERRGLDFWYTNDPSSIVDIYKYNGGYILDEKLYQKGMSNKQIADFINNLTPILVIADSAEPKSIDEIKLHWITILPADKWPDSIRNGIQLVQDQRISVTKSSVNLIKEYRNYLWKTDKDWKVLNVPEWWLDHALDWMRYALTSLLKRPESNFDSRKFLQNEARNKNIFSDIWL